MLVAPNELHPSDHLPLSALFIITESSTARTRIETEDSISAFSHDAHAVESFEPPPASSFESTQIAALEFNPICKAEAQTPVSLISPVEVVLNKPFSDSVLTDSAVSCGNVSSPHFLPQFEPTSAAQAHAHTHTIRILQGEAYEDAPSFVPENERFFIKKKKKKKKK